MAIRRFWSKRQWWWWCLHHWSTCHKAETSNMMMLMLKGSALLVKILLWIMICIHLILLLLMLKLCCIIWHCSTCPFSWLMWNMMVMILVRPLPFKYEETNHLQLSIGHVLSGRSYELSNKDIKPPQFFHYGPNGYHMMRRMNYDLDLAKSLNFNKDHWVILQPFMPKWKKFNYCHRTERGLEYAMPNTPIEPMRNISTHSYESSNWNSDTSVSNVLRTLPANMISLSHIQRKNENIGDDELNSWA